MDSGNFVIYQIDPNEMELSGEVQSDKNVNRRLFLYSTVEIKNNVRIFRNKDKELIPGQNVPHNC